MSLKCYLSSLGNAVSKIVGTLPCSNLVPKIWKTYFVTIYRTNLNYATEKENVITAIKDYSILF